MLHYNTVRKGLATLAVALCTTSTNALELVATVPPLTSLVMQVAEPSDSVELLIPANQSPHYYQMTLSQRRLIEQADAVFWIGQSLESDLAGALNGLPVARSFVASDTEADRHDDHGHDDHDHSGHAHDDAHPWMSVTESAHLFEWIAAELSELDPGRAEVFAARAEAAIERLNEQAVSWKAQAQSWPAMNYLVFHDAYQPFEADIGQSASGVIQPNANANPTARGLSDLRRGLAGQSGCVFGEPQMDTRWVELVSVGASVKVLELDPLGADLSVDADLHVSLLDNLYRQFQVCADWTSAQ